MTGAEGVDAMEVALDEAGVDSWCVARDGWNVEVECQWFCVDAGGEVAVGKGDVEVHEGDLMFSLTELPSETHGIDGVLKV